MALDGTPQLDPLGEQYASKSISPAPRDDKKQNGMVEPDHRIPAEEDVLLLARLGELRAIQKLFDSGKCDATFRDDQGVTSLHWAAIKGHYALCHFLIQSGAEVNAAGGDLGATPILWAARSCNYYIVNLLLQHGADPLRTDNQGFNLLQNATLDGNIYQLLLLLYQEVPVDTPDAQGHTSLMWAAYKGFPACVEALLRFGASVHAKDEQGFTALHWSLVKGSQECIQKLIEYGADRSLSTLNGKTPAVVAREMNSKRQWYNALSLNDYDARGNPKHFPLAFVVRDRYAFLAIGFFCWPFIMIFCCVYILSGMPIYVGVPMALLTAGILQALPQMQFVLQWNPPHKRALPHTSYLAGIFAGTLFWVDVRWLTHILPQTSSISPFSNLLFALFSTLCTYFYFLAMFEDPGWIPKPSSRTKERAVVQELVDSEEFNERSFCVSCLLRKPLRSKHCKRCQRCVAKEDHHCPWVNNCVAVNNHRHFFLYILNMELGIVVLDWLTYKYLESLPTPAITTCNILSENYCTIYNKDPFTVVLIVWATLQLSWVSMLVIVQFIQVLRAQTTYESMKGHTHMSKPSETVTSALVAGAPSLTDAGLTERSMGVDSAPAQPQRRQDGCWESWKHLLGVDTFMATAVSGSGSTHARRKKNEFSRGIITNLKDFFFDPAPLFGRRENGMAMLGGQRVDYTRLYDVPSRSIARSERRDDLEACPLELDPGERD